MSCDDDGWLDNQMPPRRKRSAESSSKGRAASKRRSNRASPAPVTAETIRAVISGAVGFDRPVKGNGGLLLPQLIEIISAFAAPFVTTKTVYKIGHFEAEDRWTVLCALDGQCIVKRRFEASTVQTF